MYFPPPTVYIQFPVFSMACSQCGHLFSGPVLPSDSDVHSVPLIRSRDKQLLVASILDSFSNLLPSATYLRSSIDTGMGFLLGNIVFQLLAVLLTPVVFSCHWIRLLSWAEATVQAEFIVCVHGLSSDRMTVYPLEMKICAKWTSIFLSHKLWCRFYM